VKGPGKKRSSQVVFGRPTLLEVDHRVADLSTVDQRMACLVLNTDLEHGSEDIWAGAGMAE
jgi:hypothetical protein